MKIAAKNKFKLVLLLCNFVLYLGICLAKFPETILLELGNEVNSYTIQVILPTALVFLIMACIVFFCSVFLGVAAIIILKEDEKV